MRVRWKLLGVAGLAGVAAGGAVAVRRRRDQHEYTPDELRAKLHERLAAASGRPAPATPPRDRPASP